MTDHPDLDTLSAYLDAEGDLDVDAHLQGCAACRDRLAPLRAVRDTLAGPVPPPSDAVRERTIAAALAAADEWAPAGRPAGVTPPATAAGVTPPATAAGVTPPATAAGVAASATAAAGPTTAPGADAPSPLPLPAPGRSRWWLGGGAVAAVVSLVVGAVALLGQEGHDTTGTALSAGPPAAESATGAAGGAGAAAADNSVSAKAGLTTVELGDVADVNALRSRVAGGTAAQTFTGDATSRANSGASAATATGAAGAAPAPAPVAGQVGTRVCEEQARTARPQLGVVVYVANLRYAGTPAVALGFAPRASDPPATLLVLAPAQGCRLLAETSPS